MEAQIETVLSELLVKMRTIFHQSQMAALLSYCSVCEVELATVIYVMRRVCLPAWIARVKYIVLIVVKVLINTLHAHHTIRYPLPAIL